MPISTEPSTFEYACNWLVSSETFCRDAMGSTAVDLDAMRTEAMARIHDEEAFDEADEEDESETAPDVPPPPPIDDRPRAIVRTQGSERKRVGTATYAGQGSLLIGMEVIVPEELRPDSDQTPAENLTRYKSRKQWARRLAETIRCELLATSGLGDQQGNAYLNATDVNVQQAPAEPEVLEGGDNAGWMGWTYEVTWKG